MPLTNVKAGEAFLIYSSAAYDNQLTIFFEGDATPLAYQDDGGPWTQGGTNASITFIAPYSGDYRILNNVYNCTTNATCIDIRVAKIWPWGGGVGGATPPCSGTFTSTSTGSGTYSFLNLTAGQNYTISTCGSSFNTQLTLYNYDGSNWRPFAYNGTNGSDCNGVSTGSVTFEAPTTSGANNYIAVVNRMTNMGANNTAYTGINNYGPIYQKWDDKDQSGTSAVLKYRSNGTTTLSATSGGTICNGTSTGSFTLSLSGSCASNALTAGTFERFNTANTALNGYGGRWTFSGAGTAQTDGSGQAYFTNGNQSAWTNAFYSNSTVTRSEGLTYYGRWYNTGTYSMIGWQDGSAGTSYANLTYALYPDAGGGLNIYESGFFRETVTAKAAGIIGLNKWIEFKIVLHNQGASYYVRNNLNGAAVAWTLVYYSTYSTAATLRPGVANYNYNNQVFYIDDLFCGGLAQYPATSGLAAGSYDYMAQDAFGNVSLTTGTISQYGVVGASLSGGSTNICHNTAPAQFSATGSGGTGAYTYLWYLDGGTTGVTTQTYNAPALSSGSGVAANHTVYCAVTSCSQTANTGTYTVTVQPLPAYSLSVSNVLCQGGSTGSITITVSAGTTPFDYSKNGSTYTGAIDQPSPFTFTSLTVGTYGILVRDFYNCVSALTNINVTEPANLPTFTETHTNVDCFGNSTGTITVTASGGTPGYTYTKDNSTYVGGNVFSGLAAATYGVRVKDNNGCLANLNNVIISQPTVLSYTSSKTDVVCNGNNDGTITLDGSGGTTPYSYSKNNGGAYSSGADPFTFTGLSPATYQVGIKDANNCPTTFTSVTISQPTVVSFTTSKVDVLCNGNSTGSITVSASGGTGTITYSKNGGGTYQASNVFSGLASGTYSIMVKDGNGCTPTAQSVTINQPGSLPSFTETHTAVLCNGGSTGTITVTASGGTAGYTYSKDNGANYQASNVFSGLAQGNYQIKVQDNNGCTTGTTTVAISQPSALSFTSSQTNVVCNGNNDGTITLDGAGGVIPYQYSKNNGGAYTSGSDPFTFTGLAPASYLVGITDANSCPTTFVSLTITEPTAVTFTTSKVDVLCNGNSSGSITVSASGGTGTLVYSKNGGTSYQASNVFSGLIAGTYSIVVKDANLCVTAPQSVTINQPASLPSFTETHTAVLCNGGNTGTITVSASGGTTAYSYTDDNGANYQAGNVFTGLSQGTYFVRVKDANGCTTLATSVNITQPTNLTVTVSQTNVVCNGNNDGTITLNGSGGVTPYTYSDDNGSNYLSGSDPYTFTGLAPAVYQAGIKDANNCVTSFTTVTITEPPVLAFTTSQVDVLCNSFNTGSITVNATGGSGTLVYSKNGGTSYQGSNVFSGLAAGNYSIVVKDANLCVTAPQSVTINQPGSSPSLTETHTPVLCYGGNTGTITVTASGGTPGYTYSNDNGTNYQAGNFFGGLSQFVYFVKVKDANGCETAATPVNITQPPVLAVSVSQTNVDCNGNNNGTITLDGSGGVSPYTYSDDNGSNYLAGSDPYTFSGLAPTTYDVGIKDANNCVTAFTTVNITEPAVLSFTESHIAVTCNGGNDGSITVSASGGTTAYSYSKNNGGTYQASNVFNGLAVGTYDVLVKDANNCVTSATTVTISGPTPVTFTTAQVHVLCNGDASGSITVTAGGGTPGYTYSNDGGTNYQVSNVFSSLAAATYGIKVKDASGCTSATQNVQITQPTLVTYTTGFTNVNCNGANDGTITITGNGGVAPYTYSKDNGSNFVSGPNPYTFNNLAPATYLAGVQDANGCVKGFTSITITEPTAVTFTTSKVDVLCFGGNNASITVSASGGTGTLTYSKDNGTSYQASNVFSALYAGTYQIKVKDASGCVTAAQSVTINQPVSALTVTASNGSPYSTTVTANLYSNPSGGTPVYTYNWSGPLSFGTNPAHTLQNPTRSNTTVNMTGTYKVTVTDANGCSASAQTIMNVYDGYVWIGTVSTDWNNNNNWSFQVPDYPDDCTQKAYIQSGTPFAPTVNIPGLTVGAITLVNGAVLTLNNDLTLCSNLVGSATAVVSNITGSGKFIMKSIPSVPQTITGKTQFDATLQIDNTAGVSVTAGASKIVNALELKSGVLTVNNPGFLTFVSNSSNHSAIIDNFSAGMTGSISGSVTMQRRYDAPTSPSYKTQHYMGSPADQPLYTAFGANGVEGRVVNPTCDEKKSASGSPYGNMAKFDENWPDAATCNLQGWYIVKTGNTENGRGYSVSRTGAGILSLTGVPNQATSYTRSSLTNSGWSNITIQGHRDTSGWHILSNPWLANLELSASGGAGMDNQVAVWQTTGPYAGGYRYYQVGFEPVDIAPFQAFMVHKTTVGGLASFIINGTDRVRTPSSVHFMSMNNDQELAINVDNTSGLRDRTVVAFNTQATDNFDPVYDGTKLWGDPDRVSLYSENNTMPMARNTLSSISNTSSVPVGFDAGLPGTFTMSFEGLNSFDATSYIMLEDKQTNAWHDVRNGNYVFSGDTTDNLARFVLHFTPAAVINHTDATCNTAGVIQVEQAGTANWNYTVANSSAVAISSGSLNNSNPITVNAAPGVYTLTLVDNHNYTVVKQIQVSGAQGVQASFVASATAVEQDDDVTFTSTSTNATNNVWNFGDNNTANGITVMHSYTSPGVYSATLTADNTDCNGMSTQQITVAEKATTAITSITDKSGITIWSNDNTVYVDFGKQPKVEAQIEIYNVLGQQLSNEKYGRSSVYHRAFNNLEAAYVIVRVKNNDDITTKKVFIGAK